MVVSHHHPDWYICVNLGIVISAHSFQENGMSLDQVSVTPCLQWSSVEWQTQSFALTWSTTVLSFVPKYWLICIHQHGLLVSLSLYVIDITIIRGSAELIQLNTSSNCSRLSLSHRSVEKGFSFSAAKTYFVYLPGQQGIHPLSSQFFHNNV